MRTGSSRLNIFVLHWELAVSDLRRCLYPETDGRSARSAETEELPGLSRAPARFSERSELLLSNLVCSGDDHCKETQLFNEVACHPSD